MLITIQFIIFLRVVSKNAIRQHKQVTINPHQDTIIDTFSGILLESEFIFPDNFHHDNPCTLVQQQLELASIVGKNNQKLFQDFTQNFVDGYFNTTIDSYKQIAIIGRGLLILSDSGILSFYTVQNENMNLRSEKYFFELNGLVKVEIYLIKEKILIFTEKDIWLLLPDFSQINIFNNSELSKIQLFSEQLTIQKVIILEQLIYITLNENEFRIYEFENNQLNLLSSMIDLNVSIKDIQVMQVEDVQHIIILDNNIKIQFYSFWKENNFLVQNKEMKPISTFGDSFLLFHNNLYLIANFVKENFFSIKMLNLNFTDNMFEQLFNIEFQGIIKDIMVTEHFIIVYSNNSISIIQNLVDETSKIYIQHFYVSGIQQMVYLSFGNQLLYLAGISKYNLFAYRIYIDKIFLKCNVSADFQKQFSFQYLVKTTYFNEQQNFNYTIIVFHHNKFEKHLHNILLVIYVFFCLKICIIIGIAHQYIQFKKYKRSEQLIEQKSDYLNPTERQLNFALKMESKEIKTTDYDKSPDPSSRVTQSPNEFSN